MGNKTSTISGMGKKKAASDRHKPSRMVRIRKSLAEQIDAIVEKNASDFTEEVNRAVREYLERAGQWPPKSDPSK